MRLNFFLTCFAIAAVIITVTFFLTVPERWFPEEVVEQNQEQAKALEGYEYELKAHDGKLAVFFYGEEQPRMVFEVYISTLPEYDKKQLSVGVPVKDYEELLIRIEDYSS